MVAMKARRCPWLPAAALLLAAGALALPASRLVSQETYSRGRWLAEGMRKGVRYSGGIVPGGPTPALAAWMALPWEEPKRGRGGVPPGPPDARVSFDILAPDSAAGAEPETEAEPSLAVDPADPDRRVALYQEDRFAAGGGARALTYALTVDGGRHWHEGLLPGLTAASGGAFARASDPWVAFGPGHAVYCAGLAFDETDALGGVYVSASSDGGATWGPPVAVHAQDGATIDDKDAIAVDLNPRSPYFGRVYVGWDISPNDPSLPQLLSIAHSTDGGATWSPPATIFGQFGNLGILPLVDPGGVVHAIWLHYEGVPGQLDGPPAAWIDSSYSTDGGDTWSPPEKVADVFHAPVPNSRTADGLPSAAIDPTTGNLYVVWQDQRFTPGVDQVAMSVSPDGKSGWSAPRRMSDGPNGAANFTPAVAANSVGQIAVSYYSFRNSPQGNNLAVDEYMTLGGPRGRPFSRGLRQSTGAWDNRAAAVAGGKFFLGDYQGLAAAGRGFFPLWIATFAPSAIHPPARQPDVFTLAVRP
jgi:BNR/Asp-box repeat